MKPRRRRQSWPVGHIVLTVCIIAVPIAGCTTHSNPGGTNRSSAPNGGSPSASGQTVSSPTPTEEASDVPITMPGPAASGGAITAGLLPLPVAASTDVTASFTLTASTRIVVGPGSDVRAVGNDVATLLRPATGFNFPVVGGGLSTPDNSIVLRLTEFGPMLGDEGYDLQVSSNGVVLRAHTAAGLFHGVQTLRQLLPSSIEARSLQPGPWRIVGGHIVDYPRFAYRGAMLDVARHFFPVADVKRYIDELALYKVNYLHLHLSDDQGWRIAIDKWPNLAAHGGSSGVGGSPGGYYTKADYTAIVEYAAAHYITVVPEIDTPSHVNAALSSYAELNCNGVAPPLYTGKNVGFSSLCVAKPVTYQFLNDVVAELAALTPGPYIHLGGDEAHSTSPSDYLTFVEKAQAIVAAQGKKLMGWAEISAAPLSAGTIAEVWNINDKGVSESHALAQGARIVAAPANHVYLDQKYTPATPLGLDWAGPIEVTQAYSWDPTDSGATDAQVLGVEAPLWSETIHTMRDIEYLAWPRMAGVAEVGWTPKGERNWASYEPRLAAQAPRWARLGVNFYRSPQVRWAS